MLEPNKFLSVEERKEIPKEFGFDETFKVIVRVTFSGISKILPPRRGWDFRLFLAVLDDPSIHPFFYKEVKGGRLEFLFRNEDTTYQMQLVKDDLE